MPTAASAPGRLTPPERRRVLAVGLLPVVGVAALLALVAVLTGATVREVVGGTLAYGGLLGLTAASVAVHRLQARQCPACHCRPERGAGRCDCGYDLAQRPRYACAQRHLAYLGPGACRCGRPLRRQHTARGLGPQVVVALRIGGLLLAFLAAVGLLVHLLEGRL